MSIKLSNTYLEKEGIRAPHYFNGRLLSAEDMTAEQEALRSTIAQLGRATGEGIAYGLEVSGSTDESTRQEPVVTVTAGLAINREGLSIELVQPVTVSLREPNQAELAELPASQSSDGRFGRCTKLPATAYASGKGVYLLTIAPDMGREGRAVTSGLGNLTACCDDKSIVKGVRFRLIRVAISDADLNDKRLRNRLAHACFGTADPALVNYVGNPFGVAPRSYGLIDSLRGVKLTAPEVPLALVFWTDTEGTRFIDQWSVRRRIIRPDTQSRWLQRVGDRRAAEQEAVFYQFQAQVEDWADTSPEVVSAVDYFEYLPAAGVLPLGGTLARNGFVDDTFFAGLKIRKMPLQLEGSRLSALLQLALRFPAIKLADGELIWTYVVRENQQAAAKHTTIAPCLVFASGHLPNFGNPRFNVARWNYANYKLHADEPL